MINVAIVEDEEECFLRLKSFLLQYGKEHEAEFKITHFTNGINFVSDYTADFDIVFMDVIMPHLNGLKAAKMLRELDREVSLIIVTSHAKYAIKGYEVEASDFIVKPVDYASFCAKMNKQVARLKHGHEPYLVVSSNIGKMRVLYSDIYYITVYGRYVCLHTRNGLIEMHISMKKLEELLANSTFVRGDNSSMVNLMHVTSVSNDGAMVNGELIPCSRNRRKALLDAFTLYLK